MVRLVDAHGAIGDTVLICKVADLPENHPENHTVGIRGQTWSRAVSISHSSLKVSPGGGINWHLRSMTVTRRQRARQDWQSRGSWVRVPSPPQCCRNDNGSPLRGGMSLALASRDNDDVRTPVGVSRTTTGRWAAPSGQRNPEGRLDLSALGPRRDHRPLLGIPRPSTIEAMASLVWADHRRSLSR